MNEEEECQHEPKKKVIEIVRKKEQIIERGPKVPKKKKVIVLRKVHQGENYVHKEEIPVSIGIPQYYNELRQTPAEQPSPQKSPVPEPEENNEEEQILENVQVDPVPDQ